jgi:hypothetical protein
MLALCPGTASACPDPPETRSAASFDQWLAQDPSRVRDVSAYEAALARAGVAGLIPMHLLLRTASRWQACNAQPYAVPPPELQPRSIRTLQLARELKARGLLPTGEVASAFRAADLNACACGSPASQHVSAAALDFLPDPGFGADKVEQLCAFWRSEGDAWQMGISQYASRRIHIDTGFAKRTWPREAAICKP